MLLLRHCHLSINNTLKPIHRSEWWTEHLGQDPIPPEYNVVRVNNAIQGHLDLPHWWEKNINKILHQPHVASTAHKPCLYAGEIQNQRVLFLQQVDDFTVVAKAEATSPKLLITLIGRKMWMDIKHLGLVIITCFNCVDAHQMTEYIKLTCRKYLSKIL